MNDARLTPLLSIAEVQQIIDTTLGMSEHVGMTVESIAPGLATVRVAFQPWMTRAGGTVSGPILMTAADAAMYAVVLAHIGPQAMTVTSNLNINFLTRPQPGDVIATGHLLKLGRRLAVVSVDICSAGDPTLVAHVTGTYALPSARSSAA